MTARPGRRPLPRRCSSAATRKATCWVAVAIAATQAHQRDRALLAPEPTIRLPAYLLESARWGRSGQALYPQIARRSDRQAEKLVPVHRDAPVQPARDAHAGGLGVQAIRA